MGVHGLWELLAPVGRRVSVETLAGKTLAIGIPSTISPFFPINRINFFFSDASIWMVQFLKAMRDEKGEMVRNAHLLGFFRRICKLLFLRTKPVFVFDGGTPALKRRTVIARRRQRENAQAKVRKTAEKLLLNHLKVLKLKEVASDIKNQRLKQKNDTEGQKKSDQKDFVGSDIGRSNVKELDEMPAAKENPSLSQATILTSCNQEELDEMLAASIAAEEKGRLARKGVESTLIRPIEEECGADEEMILSSVNTEVDIAVLAALPQSMQLDILAQLKGKKAEELMKEVDNQKQHEVNDLGKGKGILFSETDVIGCSSSCDNQDKIDEMLAASIAVEENVMLVNNASTSLGASTIEEEDGDYDEDEEMILPAMHGEVDPAVLASLPPSMQLDLLVQMRERLIAENRHKYQKVKKDPAKFSELQIQAYLKTVAFRREIDQVQKAAAGRGVGGVQTSRIASEANREYIFSSSFTGDKQELTSTRLEKTENTQQKERGTHPSRNFANSITAGNDSNTSSGLNCNQPSEPVDESIQTYLDESGRLRVSRMRAMGMRMTRDIQRNLDLMKEIEQERSYANKAANIGTVLNAKNNGSSESYGNQLVGKSREVNVDLVKERAQNEQSMLDRDTSIPISFEFDCKNKFVNGEDDIFSSLVGGNSVAIYLGDDSAAKEQPSDSDSDCDWEEGTVEGKNIIFPGHFKVELQSSVADEDNNNNESEVEWEEGDCDGTKSTLLCQGDSGKSASRGCLEEESDFQEAIRRSLESTGNGKIKCMSSIESIDERSNAYENKLDHGLEHADNLCCSGPMDLNDNVELLKNKNILGGSTSNREDDTEQNELHEIVDGDKKHDYVAGNNSQTFHFHGSQSNSSATFSSNNTEILTDKPCRLDKHSHSEDSTSDANVTMKDEVPMVSEQLLDNGNDDGKVSFYCKNSPKVDLLGVTEEKKNYINGSEPISSFTDNTKPAILSMGSSLKGSTEDLDIEPKFPGVDNGGNLSEERNSNLAEDAVNIIEDFPARVDEVRLEEEMQILGQEYINLENEQRKLERNAESVNSELFTECQELLQMFGLPYIIAPMEAEAQCAYLELAKLVDGVVTDDSDVLLFGARSVYKNIFDDRKYVETYFMEDIEKELGLSREKLIRMALLLGSDYTEGVSGIGIVNAIEVVNAFPEEDGLLKFRQWVESPDPTILGRLDAKSGSNTRKKNSESASDQNISHAQEQNKSPDYIQDIKQTFLDKHRNVSKNWHIPSSFPSETVISAYYSPHVDKSTEPFTWGKPDHLVLRKLCWEKFMWTSQKADELLLPVLKEYNKHETQLRLEAFYSFNERFAKIRSKRIKKAVKGITGKQPSDLIDHSAEDLSKDRKNGKGGPVEPGDNKLEPSKGTEESLEARKKSKMKQSRKRKNDGGTVAKAQSKKKKITDDPSVVENLQPCMQTEEEQCDGKALIWNRSRGRGRGRARGMGVIRGREKESLSIQSRETSSSSSDTDDHGLRVHIDMPEVPKDLRRSMRSRKAVNYSFKDVEVEEADADDSFDESNQTCLRKEPKEEKLSYIHGACRDGATDFSRGKESSIPLKETRDSLESEGWFCTDAGETSHPGTGNRDNSFDRDSSDGYLKMGGGFCSDDSEIGNNHNAIDDVNTAATLDCTADIPSCSEFLDETDHDKSSSDILFSGAEKAENEIQDEGTSFKFNKETNNDLLNAGNHSDMGVLTPEIAHHNSGTSAGAFSAMPFLRKKRKKN
ncbi:DNA repair protein UVH3 [Gastrolobium bilobum]|uniref:DNA repair protein UVH3 n=1 Tax=Gastrolobium bilobum TaxID=150636 RepID=UPI002AAF1B21|nr:DNA repair protein UVH3 [Gastrolobium bilobum]